MRNPASASSTGDGTPTNADGDRDTRLERLERETDRLEQELEQTRTRLETLESDTEQIDAALDLSKNRLAVRKRTERKNGLEYTERRLVLPADADVPGDRTGSPGERATAREDDSSDRPPTDDSSTSTPETADVHG